MRLVGTNIHYVPSNEVQVPTEEATGRGLKRILPLVVSFIVPVAAPWLAAKVGLSSALSGSLVGVLGKSAALAGRAIGSALTGAALGAVTGTGAGRGALLGLGGGLFSRPSGTMTGAKVPGAAAPGVGAPRFPSGKPGVGPLPTAPSAGGASVVAGPDVYVGGPGRYAPGALAREQALAGKPAADQVAAAAAARSPSGPLAKMGSSDPSKFGEYFTGADVPPGPSQPTSSGVVSRSPPVSGPAEASFGDRFQTAVGQAGSRVMKTLTDPDTILRAGMLLATGAISGSPEEQALIREQAQALRELRERDSQAFNMRMQLAQQAVGEASFYDPLAVANWAAAQARTSASAAAQQAERQSVARGSRDKGRAEAIKRAGLFQTALGGSEAFVRGYGQGVDQKRAARAAAAGLVPSAPTSGIEAAALLSEQQARKAEEERRRAAGMGSLFAGLTGAPGWT